MLSIKYYLKIRVPASVKANVSEEDMVIPLSEAVEAVNEWSKQIVATLENFRDTWFNEGGVNTGEQWQELTEVIGLLNTKSK